MPDDVIYTTTPAGALETDQAQLVYDTPQDSRPQQQETSNSDIGQDFISELEALRQQMVAGNASASGQTPVEAVPPVQGGEAQPGAETPVEGVQESPEATASNEAPSLPPLPEALAPYQKELDAYFQQMVQQYLGVQPEQLQLGVQYIQEQEVNRQLGQLQKEWSVDENELDSRLELVRERFSQLSPQEQQALDSVRGIKLLWAEIEQEQARQRPQTQAPRFDRSRGRTATGSKPLFSKSQLDQMSQADRSKYYDQIVYAYQNGLVAD